MSWFLPHCFTAFNKADIQAEKKTDIRYNAQARKSLWWWRHTCVIVYGISSFMMGRRKMDAFFLILIEDLHASYSLTSGSVHPPSLFSSVSFTSIPGFYNG